MFVAFLDWVRVGDGNYGLCRRLKLAIRNILDHVLAVPAVPPPPQRSETYLSDFNESIGTGNFDPDLDIGEPDWLSLLNSMDWTQGFGLEISQ